MGKKAGNSITPACVACSNVNWWRYTNILTFWLFPTQHSLLSVLFVPEIVSMRRNKIEWLQILEHLFCLKKFFRRRTQSLRRFNSASLRNLFLRLIFDIKSLPRQKKLGELQWLIWVQIATRARYTRVLIILFSALSEPIISYTVWSVVRIVSKSYVITDKAFYISSYR